MNKTSVLIAYMVLLFSSFTHASSNVVCTSRDIYSVGFFNGVWNTEQDARVSLAKLRDSIFYNLAEIDQIEFELFYNQTVSQLDDVYETFLQRLQEQYGIDLSSNWRSLNGSSIQLAFKL